MSSAAFPRLKRANTRTGTSRLPASWKLTHGQAVVPAILAAMDSLITRPLDAAQGHSSKRKTRTMIIRG
jgi:hypothetical protein